MMRLRIHRYTNIVCLGIDIVATQRNKEEKRGSFKNGHPVNSVQLELLFSFLYLNSSEMVGVIGKLIITNVFNFRMFKNSRIAFSLKHTFAHLLSEESISLNNWFLPLQSFSRHSLISMQIIFNQFFSLILGEEYSFLFNSQNS